MSTWVVLPTYNEAENIQGLIEEIQRRQPVEVLVVDDNSPDGTGRLVDDIVRLQPTIHVLHRPGKLGLGSAYQAGFKYALDRGATRVIQMDADGSHPPKILPLLIDQLKTYDLVLASRYVAGGSFPIVWYRRWISTLGNIYIRALLGWAVHDWSTGYKGWRADFLRRVMAEPTRGVGYAWLMETTWITKNLGGRIKELPLVFLERRGGQSKFSWRIAAEDIRLAWGLARRRPTLVPKQKT